VSHMAIGAPAILNIYNEVTIHMVNSRVYSISLFINDLEENVHGQMVKFANVADRSVSFSLTKA